MGLGLYTSENAFREEADRCFEIAAAYNDLDLREAVYQGEKKVDERFNPLDRQSVAQTVIFVTEYALAKVLMKWGVEPSAFVGHSIGEYTAACLAGVFTLEDALALVAARGRCMERMAPGSMVAVFLPESEVEPYLDEEVSIAVVNGPSLCVVSGTLNAIQKLEVRLSDQKVDHKRLRVSHAFHSHMTEPVLDSFRSVVQGVSLRAPQIPFVSNVTGTWAKEEEVTRPSYWVRHLRHTVRFSDCVKELLREKRVLLEVGPGQTLSTLVKMHLGSTEERTVLSSMRHPQNPSSDIEVLLKTMGGLWLAGVEPNWGEFYSGQRRCRVPLPSYPFERKRYWIEAASSGPAAIAVSGVEITEKDDKGEEGKKLERNEPVNPDDGKSPLAAQQTLTDIWRDLLGHDQINPDDNFFELGGHSLIAVRLFSHIEKVFGKRLPLATLIENPTIRKLSQLIVAESFAPSWASLVPIQPNGSRPPFFFVHAAGGNLIIYRDLARHLGPDQPVYGLQSQGLDGSKPFLTRIEDMAAVYVDELQAAHPKGPYFLGGYCMGGTVALEMAQQLHNRGQRVCLLALLETYNWSKIIKRPVIDDLFFYFQKIEFHFRNLMISNDFKTFFKEKLKVLRSRKDLWMEMLRSRLAGQFGRKNSQERILNQIWNTNDKAALSYIARTYAARVTLFRAVRQYTLFDRPEAGWDGLAKQGVDIHVLPVYPAGMLVEPFVRVLAKELNACIEEAIRNESRLCVVKNEASR
jgi:malonyl CoA-acyl carrier protein transacylase